MATVDTRLTGGAAFANPLGLLGLLGNRGVGGFGGGSVPPSLILSYTEATSSVSVETTGAGRLYWAIFGAAGATSGDIVSGVGASAFGFVDTLPGSVGIDLPALVPGAETWLACTLLPTGSAVYVTAEVRTQAGAVTSYAKVASVTGNPAIYNYTDAEGTWRAYEWLTDGSFTVSAPGDVDYLIVAGGGGACGLSYMPGGGGGAGGLRQGQTYVITGTQELTVGVGGLGSYGTTDAAKGTDTTALGLVAYGGGAAVELSGIGRNGGSGAGRKCGVATGFGTGVAGQGNPGAGSPNSGAPGAPAAGGGGAGGAGQSPTMSAAGSGGAGITSSILGFDKGFAGGGVGATGAATTTATGSHGAATVGATGVSRKGGDGVNGTGAGGSGSAAIANTILNRGGKGGNGAVIIRVRLA